MEVFCERRIWGPRKALIRVGDPINLRDHLEACKADKRGTIASVSMNLEEAVRRMLTELSEQHGTPLG
jgi:hypothetical protein